jgi:hypothetical protein
VNAWVVSKRAPVEKTRREFSGRAMDQRRYLTAQRGYKGEKS